MTRKPRTKANPLQQEIELALNPGAFIPDRTCFSFVSDLDDSSGSFGQLGIELYCGWIKARQVEGANPDETASRLLT